VIHEVGETSEGRHYIAMEYIDGVTLRQRMKEARLKLNEVLDVAVQIASGLAGAHEVGVMHRDIKPENIMLRRDGYVKVLDFGLARGIHIFLRVSRNRPSTNTRRRSRWIRISATCETGLVGPTLNRDGSLRPSQSFKTQRYFQEAPRPLWDAATPMQLRANEPRR
jgi:serine/threonine protein kinase